MAIIMPEETIEGVIESCDVQVSVSGKQEWARGSLKTGYGYVLPFILPPKAYKHPRKHLLHVGWPVVLTGKYSKEKSSGLTVLVVKEITQRIDWDRLKMRARTETMAKALGLAWVLLNRRKANELGQMDYECDGRENTQAALDAVVASMMAPFEDFVQMVHHCGRQGLYTEPFIFEIGELYRKTMAVEIYTWANFFVCNGGPTDIPPRRWGRPRN